MGPLIANNPHSQPSSKETYSMSMMSCISPPTYSIAPTAALPLAIPQHTNSAEPKQHVDNFITDLLQAVTDEIPLCSSCEEGIPASSRCRDCSELLCDPCVRAHLRVRITKDHQIVRFTNSTNTISATTGSLGSSSQASNSPCSSTSHHSMSTPSSNGPNHYHDPTYHSIYSSSSDDPSSSSTIHHHNHNHHHQQHNHYTAQEALATEAARVHTLRLASEVRGAVTAVRGVIDAVQRGAEGVEGRGARAAIDVRNVIKRYISNLEECERDLLGRFDRLKRNKVAALRTQADKLRLALAKLARTADMLNDSLESGSRLEMNRAGEQATIELKQLRSIRAEVLPPTGGGDGGGGGGEENLSCWPMDPQWLKVISSLGPICTPANIECFVRSLIRDTLTQSTAALTSPDPIEPPKSIVDIKSITPDPIACSAPMSSLGAIGNSSLIHQQQHAQHQQLDNNHPAAGRPGCAAGLVGVNGGGSPPRGRPVHGLMAPIVVRDMGAGSASVGSGTGSVITAGAFSFGSEGELDGQLCRPWGVCCDRGGHIIVADRSNNRVQVFHPNGLFSHKFGVQGTGLGQFDRPAGVAVDPQNRIVVADKDNHRIQLFTLEGNFVLLFGEKGSRNGQFNYPWDVAVNSKGHIIVSDTRNHRVQLFTNEGMFINKYGFEGSANMWKHFDSPRGVAFNPNGSILITDFNNHRLVVIDQNLQHAQFLGQEGSGFKQFLRPQGIVCDDEGRIIVADSRNNRIQVFESNGTFLWKVGQVGKGSGELDRPSGICINPEGRIVVVDFGNNRVQIF